MTMLASQGRFDSQGSQKLFAKPSSLVPQQRSITILLLRTRPNDTGAFMGPVMVKNSPFSLDND